MSRLLLALIDQTLSPESADLSARDVTPRYTKSYNNYTVKMRAPSKKGTDWFAELLKPFERSFELVSISQQPCY